MTSSSLNDALSGAMTQESLRSAAQRASRDNTVQPVSPSDPKQQKSTQDIEAKGSTHGHFEQQITNTPPPESVKHERASDRQSAIPTQSQSKEEPQRSETEARDAVSLADKLSELNNVMYALNRKIKFEVDDTTEALIVRVINKETDEVIRQYPKEEVLKRMERLLEGDTGSFSTEIE